MRKPFDGLVLNNVRFDDFVHVRSVNATIEHSLGIDRNGRAELALIKTSGLVGTNQLDAPLCQFDFEQPLQFPLAACIAAAAGMSRFALVHANENMLDEFGHGLKISAPNCWMLNLPTVVSLAACTSPAIRESHDQECGLHAGLPQTTFDPGQPFV
jgi:hypothetical protein